MGICGSIKLPAHDRKFQQTSKFVRHAAQGNVESVLKMIVAGQDVHAVDRFGLTALHWACYQGKFGVIKVLMESGALVEALDSNGRNALHHACRKNHSTVAEYLIHNLHMDVNTQTENGDTALHKAARALNVECVEVLLKYGADPNLKNCMPETVMDELKSSTKKMLRESSSQFKTIGKKSEMKDVDNQVLEFKEVEKVEAPLKIIETDSDREDREKREKLIILLEEYISKMKKENDA